MSILSKDYENYLKRYERIPENPLRGRGEKRALCSVLPLSQQMADSSTNEQKGVPEKGLQPIRKETAPILGTKIRNKTAKENKKG